MEVVGNVLVRHAVSRPCLYLLQIWCDMSLILALRHTRTSSPSYLSPEYQTILHTAPRNPENFVASWLFPCIVIHPILCHRAGLPPCNTPAMPFRIRPQGHIISKDDASRLTMDFRLLVPSKKWARPCSIGISHVSSCCSLILVCSKNLLNRKICIDKIILYDIMET